MSDWNNQIIAEFRANGGKVAGRFVNTTLLLLHTNGAKTGMPRINPVACLADGERYIIIASKGGADTNPDWYYNLLSNPEVSIEVGMEEFPALATVAAEPERSELYAKMVAINPGFADYEKKTSRKIPVIILSRR